MLPHLLATVQQSQSPEVQLLAAQTLRKHIPRDWRRLSSQVCPLTLPGAGSHLLSRADALFLFSTSKECLACQLPLFLSS